ncbi:MAG: MFS transporter, partial [Gaiellaceae bacterium]
GFGSAFAYTGALAWVAVVAPRARRGEAIGFAFAAAFSGALVGPLVGAAAESAGSAVVFSAVAAVAVLLAAVAATLEKPAAEGLGGTRLRPLARDGVIRLGIWLIALTGLLLGVLGVLAPLRLDELGWGAAAIGAVFAIAGVLQTVANPIVGRLADTRGGTFPLRVGLIVSAAASALLIVDERAALYATLVVVAGTAYAILWTPATALLSRRVERRGYDQASAFGLMSAAWPPGFAVGAAAGGALAGATRDAWPYLLAALVCLLSLSLLGRARPSGSPEEP